jgi:GTP-binding protein
VLYATQADARTRSPIPIPEIIFFCNDEKLLVDTYRRFLEARIREKTPYTGLPLLFHLRAREVKGAEKKRPVRGKPAPEGEAKPVRVKKITHKPPATRRKALPARGMTGGRKGG